MPILNWIGKDKVINHHLSVDFKILNKKYTFNTDKNDLHTEQNSENKIINGDNLEALKALLPQYEGKIKCIYIDPPYNTGNENWIYNDNVNDPKIKKWLGQVVGKESEDLTRHDKWLCMMYPRLKLLHKLLKDDGAIFISIDDNEQANLKLICDEIFGAGNFIGNIIWEKKSSPQNDAKWISDSHDFVVLYAKDKSIYKINKQKRTNEQNAIYKNSDEFDGINANGEIYGRGTWFAGDMTVKTINENALYPIVTPAGNTVFPAKGRAWVYFEDKFKQLCEDNRITFGKSGSNKPCIKRFLLEIENNGIVPKSNWHYSEVGENRNARQELKKIFSEIQFPFETPKPTTFIQKILELATDTNSIILDSFAGSGTTAHAVLNLNKADGGNRKFILIEMEDYAESITAERVRRVMQGYTGNAGTGGSFDFYELGEVLFDEDGFLNEKVSLDKIRAYIWFSETNTELVEKEHNDDISFLGKDNDTSYYFHYVAGQTTTLYYDFLAKMRTQAEQYIIYADNCLLTPEFLRENNIFFKKIPREIRKF
jgi:adenine-specific DNA-methyltransferase